MNNELLILLEQVRSLEKRLNAMERREYTSGGGAGDMLKSVYDKNDDGIVDSAANADTVDSLHASAFAAAAKGVTNGDSHDHSGGDGAQIDHGGLGGLGDDDHTQYLKADGTRALSADWDVGDRQVRAKTLYADVATGTAPLTITSTTKVANLNADLLDGYEASQFREKLSAARTYYVRKDGNDNNNGLTDSSGGAFLTIQKAVDTVAALDINGYAVTIQVRDGTYAEAVTLKNVVGYSAAGDLTIQGNSSTPTNVIVQASGDCFAADGVPVCWDIKNMQLDPTSYGLKALYGSYIRYSGVDFAASSVHIWAGNASKIVCTGNYTISGNASYHIWVTGGSIIACQTRTVTVTADVSITKFAYVRTCGFLVINGCTFSLGAFSVTGKRYEADLNGVINTASGGATYLPGNSDGSTATGGQYV